MHPWRERPAAGLPPGSRVAAGRTAGGLEVWLAEVPGATQARLALGVGAGYLDEPASHPGLAHLLEHALFLEPGDDASTFGDWVGAQGGRYNARTDDRVTDFHLTLPPEALDAGLARLVALVAAPRLEPGAVAAEVAVIDAEFRARLADPALHRLAALSRLCRPDHPARHCHAGNAATLEAAPAALCTALEAFHRRHYRAGAMTLALLAPRPLAALRAAVEAAARLPPGGAPRAPEGGWADPAGVCWVSPAGGGELELAWPLPAGAAAHWHGALERLAATLTDGRLAATLAARHRLATLEASPEVVGAGPGLSLRLTLDDGTPTAREAVLATCAARVQALAADTGSLPAAPVAALDLEAWPRERVRAACRRAARESAVHDPRPLDDWLAPRRCRWLAAVDELPAAASRVPMTGTRHVLAGSLAAEPRPLPPAAPPLPAASADPPTIAAAGGSPRRLAEPVVPGTWLGGGPAALAPSLCLGWPAAACGRAARLAHWRHATLALAQAVAYRGGRLELGGDARGDWLALAGPPVALEAAARAALAAWPGVGGERPAPPGLLAQRLLARLEEAPATAAPSRSCAWVAGLAAGDAAALVARLGEALPAASSGGAPPGQGETAVTVSGDADRAVMLEVQGSDEPVERLYLRLLAQCHDAAFFAEMRRRRGLGYAAAVRYREAAGRPRLGYVVQSPHAGVEALQAAVAAFLADQGRCLATLDVATFARRRRALAGQCGLPETPVEAWRDRWQALRRDDPAPPWETTRAALARLDAAGLEARATALVDGRLAWRWWRVGPAPAED